MKNLSVCFVFLGLFGCTTTAHKFTLVSTMTSQANLSQGKVVTGEACRKDILFFIPISGDLDQHRSGLEDAIDNALSKEKGSTALVNVKVKHKFLMTVAYNEFCTIVEGMPVKVRSE
jgi:hypothetical protein